MCRRSVKIINVWFERKTFNREQSRRAYMYNGCLKRLESFQNVGIRYPHERWFFSPLFHAVLTSRRNEVWIYIRSFISTVLHAVRVRGRRAFYAVELSADRGSAGKIMKYLAARFSRKFSQMKSVSISNIVCIYSFRIIML